VLLNKTFVQSRILKTATIFIVAALAAMQAFAQEVSDVMVAPDSSVIFSVSRVNGEIFVVLDFSKNLVFEHATVERKPEFQTSFSQCMYISFKEAQSKDRHVVKKDNYPYHNSADVLYRATLVTKEGERIYSSVHLPAAGH
jgi:hypothetical protein